MTPFNTKEVACYLLWVAIAMMVVGIIAFLLFHARGREPIHATHDGTAVVLRMPNAGAPPPRA